MYHINHLILSVPTNLYTEWPYQYGCPLAAFSQNEALSSMHRNVQIKTELYGLIEAQWEKLINVTKVVIGETYETGKLYFQRARYFVTKMEHSLKEFNFQSLPIRKGLKEFDISKVPVVEDVGEDPPTVQFKQLCQLILEQQEGHKTEDQYNDMVVINEEPLKNNVSASDFQLAVECIQQAIKIFQQQLKADRSEELNAQIEDLLSFAKGNRAIIMMIGSKYTQAAIQLRSIIEDLSQRKADGDYSNQLVAEYTFILGNCILLSDQSGCQKQVLQLFLKSIRMYLNHLLYNLNYDAEFIPIPQIDGTPTDRLPYLNKPSDSEQVKLIKEVMSIILDKIEDVSQILKLKKAIQSKRQKKQSSNQYRQSTLFGRKSRKRRPLQISQSQRVDTVKQHKVRQQYFSRQDELQQWSQ